MTLFDKLFKQPKQTISLKDFALTGEFGPVKVGMHKEEVIKLLGPPDEDNDFDTGYGGLLYGSYEFFYSIKTAIIESIQNDHLTADHHYNSWRYSSNPIFKNKEFQIDPWFLKKGKDVPYKNVIQILKEEQIPFKETIKYDCPFIEFESGVTLDFTNFDGYLYETDDGDFVQNLDVLIHKSEGFALNGIRYFPKS
ncbi:MAG: hypothetical protein AB8F95_17615 [Bacteroidia bacterium]